MAQRPDQKRASTGKGAEQQAQKGSSAAERGARITELARVLGNDEIAKRMAVGNASRDQMLAFLCDRLETMRELQLREFELTRRGAHFWWWRQVADANKPQYTSPEPTRWNEAAGLYEDASRLLCQGHLKRGRDVLERAIKAEERAREGVSDLVDQRELNEGRVDSSVLAALSVTEVAGACDEPAGVQVAREIQAMTTESPRIPNRSRATDPWWTIFEEEEEEEPHDGGG